MFDWLKRVSAPKDGLSEIMQYFGQMLEDGRHSFDVASNSLLGGTDPEIIRDDLWATDKRINRTERRIRRLVVTHGTVHGANELPICLVVMSLVKDAERIGDYAKNIFDLAHIGSGVAEDSREDLIKLKDTISRMMAKARNLYELQDEEGAQAFCSEADALQSHCDAKINSLLIDGQTSDTPGKVATAALTYRFFKRTLAHMLNIISSVLMPLDRLDYFDEDPESRDSLND